VGERGFEKLKQSPAESEPDHSPVVTVAALLGTDKILTIISE
jgi:hypothetical protein